MSAFDDVVRRLVQAENDAIEEACRRARLAGCGVKVTRSADEYDFYADPASATSTLTVEVSRDVPAGEIHLMQL